MNLLNQFTNLYPIWLILTAVLGFLVPDSLAWFSGNWINAALTVVMLGMGFTLTVEDFRRLFRTPGCVTFGFLAQYTLMPLIAWALAYLLRLDPGIAVGLILLGSCPGGTASNVVTYLARADVALSVAVTILSTLVAFILTPFWVQVLAGQYVAVDAWGLCKSTFLVIVAPVIVGTLLNWMFPKAVARVAWTGPVISVLAICMITGGIVAQSADAMVANAMQMTVAVTLLHLLGFIVGYALTRSFGYSRKIARTISIEVGMQNGGMAAMLAKAHFPMHPLAAVPSVFSAMMQNIMGALLAAWWRARTPIEEEQPNPAIPAESVTT